MLKNQIEQSAFAITHIATCDFEQMESLTNAQVLARGGKGGENDRLARFIEKTMGVNHRYHSKAGVDAESLAINALERLFEKDPTLVERAEFLIFAGISSPRPTATLSARLAHRFNMPNVSCWDIKSGCSTAVLALIQGQSWLSMGAKCGIVVSSETLSRFSAPDLMQMAAATGDGAVALAMEASDEWMLKSIVHGTDAKYANNILMPGKFPVNPDSYSPSDYLYQLDEKGDTIEKLQYYWVNSLTQLLEGAKVIGSDVNHYIAHQVDGSKNEKIALAGGIRPEAVAKNFQHFGNMGAPTVLINYHQWINRPEHQFYSGDTLVFHAVGGGISWAGMCLQRL